jgi:hypothetical protein
VLRHRVMSADGRDLAVTTTRTAQGYTTGVYPVQNGYLVMVCQPLFETGGATLEEAHEQHEQLVRVLAELGVRVVRARRFRELRIQAERETDAGGEVEPASSLGATA